MSNDKFETIKPKFARSLKEYLYNEAQAPNGETPVDFDLHIPFHQIKQDEDESNRALAVVTYVVRCPTEKKHTVNVSVAYDKQGRVVKDSLNYV